MLSVVYLIHNFGCNIYFSSDCDLPSDIPFPSPSGLQKCNDVPFQNKTNFKEVKKSSLLRSIEINYSAVFKILIKCQF